MAHTRSTAPRLPISLRRRRRLHHHHHHGQHQQQSTAAMMAMTTTTTTAAMLLLLFCQGVLSAMDECYDDEGRPQRCLPEFVNAAFNVTVESTNTCGSPAEEYCVQTGVTGVTKSCHVCDASDARLHHNATFLTDFNNQDDTTWWQSPTMLRGVQYPKAINLTLRLGKAFDITYVRLKFHTSRPESFAIYKRASMDGPWTPYQYYSGSCEPTYDKRNRGFLRSGDDEQTPLCTDEFSDISPLTGGNVAFSTLEGRPSAYNFDNSPVLQDWVSSTEIRVTLNRLNTFGDEVFNDHKVLRSYYYAISDFAVGGRCKCNGHASECVKNEQGALACKCRHNTMGADCEKCLPLYNDRPWHRATSESANECTLCDCNGRADECYFDPELYRATGHGGHCTNCRDNTDGKNCERCLENFYRRSASEHCLPCNCNPVGSYSRQCDQQGRCSCKQGVMGERCDQCLPGFHSMDEAGCRLCTCNPAGTLEECQPDTGRCVCKDNVEGYNCDSCKPGFFNLDALNRKGCTACFCYGHSSVCSSAQDHSVHTISSDFRAGQDGWLAEERDGNAFQLTWNSAAGELSVSSEDFYPIYFLAADKFLGNQLLSYGQNLTFKFRVDNRDVRLSAEDLVLEGAELRVSVPLIAQGNSYPTEEVQTYHFLLHEVAEYPWRPQLTTTEFQRLLSNLTSVKIRGTYNAQNAGHLQGISLTSARRGPGPPAPWVEHCSCPPGYQGQFCESCAPGFTREEPGKGPFSSCVPCACHSHSATCHPETGECRCEHNTAGRSCERCRDGFYGDATQGSDDDCAVCPCPSGSSCAIEPRAGEVVCTSCPEGTTGKRCELCDDGYFGDPTGQEGPSRPCRKCECTENIDPNAVGNCDRRTGECLKCIYNTGGFYCDRCLDGFYGDARLPLPDKCKPCACFLLGTVEGQTTCNPVTGQCDCLPHVAERDCRQCEAGFYDIASGNGCKRCECHPVGSQTGQCDITTGQCDCRPGVEGRACEVCAPNHFGFSVKGCSPCDCDFAGAKGMQCDEGGHCPCRNGAVGVRCDQCGENFYRNRTNPGCQQCPPCYSLVESKVNSHREKLRELERYLEGIGSDPGAINDRDFEQRLQSVGDAVVQLLWEVQSVQDADYSLLDRLADINATLTREMTRLRRVRQGVDDTTSALGRSRTAADDVDALAADARQQLERARKALSTVTIDPRNVSDPNNLTGLVDEARKLADEHKNGASEIEGTANMALNSSQTALDLLSRILVDENELGEKALNLTTKLREAKNLTSQLEKYANQVQSNATDVGDVALNLYTQAKAALPQVNISALETRAEHIGAKSEEVMQRTGEKEANLHDLLNETRSRQEKAAVLLQRGLQEQKTADQLLARADAAYATANDAATAGNRTLAEAKEILDYIKDFDRRVADNKTAAEEAIKKIPTIEAKVAAARNKTQATMAALGSAERDAKQARRIAQDAERIANQTQADSAAVKEEAGRLFSESMALNDDMAKMQDELLAGEEMLATKQADAMRDMDMATNVTTQAQSAEDKARKARNTVRETLKRIKQLLEQLDKLQDIDGEKLAELERELKANQDRMANEELADKIKQLEDAGAQQDRALQNYERDIGTILADIKNLEDIRDALPQGCFNAASIENP
ncbi:laminin subunit gamma-1 isoform X1 [Lampetra fluviatilis]